MEPKPDSKRKRELYLEAIRIQDPDERQRFLDERCARDSQLRCDLVKLLNANAPQVANPLGDAVSSETNLSTPEAMGIHQESFAVEESIDVSNHPMIGRYKLLEQIGHGGMGTVYMAQQSEPVQRKVALKVIKPGMDTREVIARFEAERQALALMDHPNIARVLDGGSTDEGRPYFVMELVRGVPITQFCEQKNMSLRERLELFVDVCKAVQHAHQKGIIHRDLKPSNIMVTLRDGVPVVKVIDFGVAKALSQQLTEKTLYTHYSQVVGTPLYMAPEQAEMSCLDVDTRSDIYSLGVVLYELLTGTTPFDRETLSSLGIDGIRKLLQDQEPPRPSVRVSTLRQAQQSTIEDKRKLDTEDISNQLKRELDWIVMKALEKDRERRYETANAFAADVQRYLNDEPVRACPPTVSYRLRKYIRKHKAWLTTAALLILMMVTSTAVSGVFAYQANEARKEADGQRNEAIQAKQLANKRLEQSRVDFDRALNSLDTIVSEVSSAEFAQLPGVERMREEILERAISLYDEIIKDHDNDPYARYQRAKAFQRIGGLYGRLSRSKESVAAFNKSLQIAEELVELVEQYPDEPLYRSLLRSVLFSRMHSTARTSAEKLEDARRALKLRIEDLDSSNPSTFGSAALLHYKIAERLENNAAEAQKHIDAALRLCEEVDITPHAAIYKWIADRALEQGEIETAITNYKNAIEKYGAVAANPKAPTPRFLLNQSISSLGAAYAKAEQYDLAETNMRQAFEKALQLDREYNQYNHVHWDFFLRTELLTNYLRDRNRTDDALKVVLKAIDAAPDYEALRILHVGLLNRSSDPLAALTEAIETWPAESVYYRYRGASYRERMEFDKALADANRSVDLSESDRRFNALFSRALTYVAMGDDRAAIEDYNQILEVERPEWDDIQRRGACYFRLGDYQKALVDLKEGLKRMPTDVNKLLDVPPSDVATCESETYRSGYLDLVDEVVKKNKSSTQALIVRAVIKAAFHELDQVREDLQVVIERSEGNYYTHYQAALLALEIGEAEDFALLCRQTLGEPYASLKNDNATETHFTAWTCALAPNALDEYETVIELARNAVEKDTNNQQYLTGLGAILLRAGQYDEAKQQLEKALKTGENDNTSPSYIHYFLAMTEHHLGNANASEDHLKKANDSAEEELADSPAWNRRLTLDLLQKEAEALIRTDNQN